MASEQITPRRVYRKRRRAEQEAQTRLEITEAAVRLHGTIGPARTTIKGVAAEAGVQSYEVSGWFVMLAPRATPAPIVARLNAELNAALSDPSVRERFTEQGAQGVIMTPDQLGKFISSETTKWSEIITKAGIPQIQ